MRKVVIISSSITILLGATLFSNGKEEEKIQFSSNAYYSKWEWQK